MLTQDDYVLAPSGLMLPHHVAERQIKAAHRPKAMDFFSGAGGFSLGAIQAGYEVVAAVEYDPIPVMTYMMNLCRYGQVTMHFLTEEDRERTEKRWRHEYKSAGIEIKDDQFVASKTLRSSIPAAGSGWIKHQPASTPGVSHIFVGDVRHLTGERILETIGMKRGELDMVCGGPPCQGYSTSGKRDVYDPRNSLVFEYARMIVELLPKAMAMEEVPNILNMVTPEGYPVVDQFCRILEDGGFGGFNAMQRLLGGKPNLKTVIRGKGTRADMKKAGAEVGDDEPDEDIAQPDLFGV